MENILNCILIVCETKSFGLTPPSDIYLLSFYSFICVFVCTMYVCICVGMYLEGCECIWRPEISSSIVFLETAPYGIISYD